MSTSGPKYGLVPALLTSTSIRPNRAIAASTQAAAWSGSAAWAACASTSILGWVESSEAATSSRASWRRDVSTTLQPSAANSSAVARPIPRDAPVTMTVRVSDMRTRYYPVLTGRARLPYHDRDPLRRLPRGLLRGRLDHHADELLGAGRPEQYPPGAAQLRLHRLRDVEDRRRDGRGGAVAHRYVDQNLGQPVYDRRELGQRLAGRRHPRHQVQRGEDPVAGRRVRGQDHVPALLPAEGQAT